METKTKTIIIMIVVALLILRSEIFMVPEKTAGQKVIFRTNAVSGDYEDNAVWIAVDANNDGVLEGFGYKGYSTYNCQATDLIVSSPEGYEVCSRSGYDPVVRVYLDTGTRGLVYESSASAAQNAVLSTSPTEPYTSNNQEVYEGGNGNGGGTGCTGINADTNYDCKISTEELLVIGSKWISG